MLSKYDNEVTGILRNDDDYANDLKIMPLKDLKDFLYMCKEMVENNDLLAKTFYPKGDIVIVEDCNTNPELIEKSLKILEQHGDAQIKSAIKDYHNGERKILFSKMPETQNGRTECKNESYVNYLSEELNHDSPENKVRIAVTLAHEFRRNANSNTLTGETRGIILEDTKIIESFANAYGEGIYKKFPEYGILHYIKKIFGETELKEFADYAFDSTGSYWKVNEVGDLIDDGKISRVADAKGSEIHSGTKGLQGTLQEWLGLENAYAALMQPAGFEWDGKQWSKNPGKIDHSVIEKAHNDGQLTDDQYNLIQLAAGKSASDDKSEKINLFKQFFSDYKQANIIKTQVQVDIANRAWEWIVKKLRTNLDSIFRNNESARKNKDFAFCNFEIFNQLPSLIPSKTWNKNTMEKEGLFASSIDSTKCNMFLPKYLISISESVYNDIITEKNAKANRLNELFSINPKLYKITGNEYDVSKRIPELNRRGEKFIDQKKEYSAAKKAIIAQDLANESKLVIAYVTDHVAIVTKQDAKYSCYPEENWNPNNNYNPFQTGDGYSNGIVLDGFPVFLQVGSYTGVVNPGMAMGRNGFTNDEVIYYVYKG